VAHTNRDAGLPGSLDAHPGEQIRIPYCVTNSARTDRVTVGLFEAQKYVEHFYLSVVGSIIRFLDRWQTVHCTITYLVTMSVSLARSSLRPWFEYSMDA
jgi:hypothetical protein